MLLGGCWVDPIYLALPQSGAYDRRNPSQVTELVVHHSGTPGIDPTAEQIAEYHVRHNGWPGIGYHFLIHWDGRIEYVGDLCTTRWHAGDYNSRSVGACLCGDWSSVEPYSRQLMRCRMLRIGLQVHLGRPLAIFGHRDLGKNGGGPTACPGDTWPLWKGALDLQPASTQPA